MSRLQDAEGVLRKSLESYPEVPLLVREDNIVTALSDETGFPVTLWVDDYEYTVGYGDFWHGHFETIEEAVTSFLQGLSPTVRVREFIVEGEVVASNMEEWFEGDWVLVSAVVAARPEGTDTSEIRDSRYRMNRRIPSHHVPAS